MVKKRQALSRLAFCSRKNLSVVVLGFFTLFALRQAGGIEKWLSFGSNTFDFSDVKGMLVDFRYSAFFASLTVVCVYVVDTRQLAATADYVNPDLPEVPQKKQYHVILPCDGRIYHEWQARVVCCCELYLVCI